MDHDEFQTTLAAHALTALDAGEAREVESHAESCIDCRKEADTWQEITAQLALTSPPVEPSLQTRARLMESIRSTSAEERSVDEKSRNELRSKANVVELSASQKKHGSFVQTWAIAACLLFIGLISSVLVLWQQNRAKRQELARLTTQFQATEQQLIHERDAIGILTRPGARLAQLSGTKVAPSASAILAYDQTGRAILLAKGLPPAPAGKAYQLWFIAGGQPLPGRVFSPGNSGEGTLDDQIPAAAVKASVFAITLEPSSGTQAPTGAIYLTSGS